MLFQKARVSPLNRNLCPRKLLVRTGQFEAEAAEAVGMSHFLLKLVMVSLVKT
jgi:hypothetical protein